MNPIGRAPELPAFVRRQEATGRRPLIVDAGANIGASPVYFIANLPSALVVAIEPDLENFKLLSKNVEGLNVEALRSAVASTAGRARVLDPGRGEWAYRTEPIDESDSDVANTVPRVTINDIYASHRAGHFPFIVKVDIEGAERELFYNTEWVAQTYSVRNCTIDAAQGRRDPLRCASASSTATLRYRRGTSFRYQRSDARGGEI